MEAWQILLIIASSLAALVLLALLIAYLTYKIAFFSDRKRGNDAYLQKNIENCGEYKGVFEELFSELEKRPYESVSLNSYDGLRLFAKYYHMKDGAPLHILFHGYRSRGELDMVGAAHECLSISHNVLLIDQRASGMSEGKTICFGIKERRDLLLWSNYAKERFGEDVKIFLWGVSMGGATVLMSLDLPLPENVIGVISDCPYSSPEAIISRVGRHMHMPVALLFPFLRLGARIFGGFRLGESSAEKSVVHAKIPVLLIHGEKDNFVPVEMSERIAAAAKSSGVDLRFLKFENATHGMSYLMNTEEYRRAVLGFIAENSERNK